MKKNLTQSRISLRSLKQLLTFFALYITTLGLHAQVTIGDGTPPQKFSILEIVSNSQGGLRLPQLSTVERNAITDAAFKSNSLAQGLSIFNTTTKCFEYWNNTRWVSLCKGDANIIFKDENNSIVDPFATPFLCAGETRGAFTPHDSEPCVGMPAAFDFLVVVGSDYASVEVVESATGKFNVSMLQNPSAKSRNAVIRITNNCTGEYKEFLFTQEGCTDLCQPTLPQPTIQANSSDICSAGAVYLYITNVDPIAKYIWTVNGSEIVSSRGKSYCAATVNGEYRVYLGGIGCDSNASNKVNITLNNTNIAPPTVESIDVSNNGVICAGGDIELTAYGVPTSAGTLVWFKNGQNTGLTANPLKLVNTTDVGDWFAVMVNGGCYSKPSNVVAVTYNTTSTPLPDPVVTINGVNLSTATLCKNGYTELDVANKGSYTTGVTISWYNGKNLLGIGAPFVFAPIDSNILLRCVIHDNSAVFCDAEVSASKTTSGSAPGYPSILGGTIICGSSPAILAATSSGATSYVWYYNDVMIPGETSFVYHASKPGKYQVQGKNAGGCVTPKSIAVDVTVSAAPAVQFLVPPAKAESGATLLLEVMASYNPTKYTWSVDGGAIFLDGSAPSTGQTTTSTNSVRVKVGANGSVHNVKCYATNDCGNGLPTTHAITVENPTVCVPPTISNSEISATGPVQPGTPITMSVTAIGTNINYQWKRGTVSIVGATNSSYTIASAQISDEGQYSVVVTGDCGTVTYVVGEVSVEDITSVPDGTGILSGPNCFDVNLSNWNGTCGTKGQRLTADFSKTYTYSFMNQGTGNSDLRWVIVESTPGAFVDVSKSSTVGLAGTLTNGQEYKITLKYKPTIADIVKGSTADTGHKVTIYAVFKVGTIEYKKSLVVSFRDCRCACGANTIGGGWITFMCHNLGVDETLDPFEPSRGLYGDLYQWGRRRDGHQLRNSLEVTNLSQNNEATSPSVVIGNFITTEELGDWRMGGYAGNRWGDGSITNPNPPKGPTDPCPDGWKVPSRAQWASIFRTVDGPVTEPGKPASANANSFTWLWPDENTAGIAGYYIGDALFIPAAGYRKSSGLIWSVDYGGIYWTSNAATESSTSSQTAVFTQTLISVNSGYHGRSGGLSVRCVLDE